MSDVAQTDAGREHTTSAPLQQGGSMRTTESTWRDVGKPSQTPMPPASSGAEPGQIGARLVDVCPICLVSGPNCIFSGPKLVETGPKVGRRRTESECGRIRVKAGRYLSSSDYIWSIPATDFGRFRANRCPFQTNVRRHRGIAGPDRIRGVPPKLTNILAKLARSRPGSDRHRPKSSRILPNLRFRPDLARIRKSRIFVAAREQR